MEEKEIDTDGVPTIWAWAICGRGAMTTARTVSNSAAAPTKVTIGSFVCIRIVFNPLSYRRACLS